MSEDISQEFIDFCTLVQGDSSLRDHLVACQDLDSVLAIAEGPGFQLSQADISKIQELGASAMNKRELNDDELSSLAGGSWTTAQTQSGETVNSDGLVAFVGGFSVAGIGLLGVIIK
jgi:predicted ribosomally synthesized peptide with nif11-like leader